MKNLDNDFELDSKTEEILNTKMALALIRMLYMRNMLNKAEYLKMIKEANRNLGLKTKLC